MLGKTRSSHHRSNRLKNRILSLSFALALALAPNLCHAFQPHVVVIGSGPIGLLDALESHEAGAQVTLVDKREPGGREQTILLDYDVHERIKHFVGLDRYNALKREGGIGSNGEISIGDIEKLLLEALIERDSPKVKILFEHEFVGVTDGKIKIRSKEGTTTLEADLLVGADGAHSKVAEVMGTTYKSEGERMQAIGTVIPKGKGSHGETFFENYEPILFHPLASYRYNFGTGKSQTVNFVLTERGLEELGKLKTKAEKEGFFRRLIQETYRDANDTRPTSTDIERLALSQLSEFAHEQRRAESAAHVFESADGSRRLVSVLTGDAERTQNFTHSMGVVDGARGARNLGDLVRNAAS